MDAITVDVGLITNSNSTVGLASTSSIDTEGYAVTYSGMTDSLNLFAAQHSNNSNVWHDLNFLDPTDDILFVMNELMFRAGVMSTHHRPQENLASRIDSGVSVNQKVSATQEKTQNVYKSDLRWYAGAAAIQVLTALVTLPMFWGWWRLGCNLTLSPFSIALAFDSPVLSDINSAAGPAGVVSRLGGLKLKYGVVETQEEKAAGTGFYGRLGVAESSMVSGPDAGMTFGR